jgi:ribosomal protein L24E
MIRIVETTVCAHCGGELPVPMSEQRRVAFARMGAFPPRTGGRPRRFCSDACRKAAFRRRHAKLAENDLRDQGRRGRVALNGQTRAELRTYYEELIHELEATKAALERSGPSSESIYEGRGLVAVGEDDD